MTTVHKFGDSLAASHAQASAPWWWEVYHQAFGDRLEATLCVRHDGWAQRGGIDRQLILTDGTILKVDEKVRYKDYPDFFLEVSSDDSRRPPDGWMEKPLTCDFIAYAFVPSQTCYLLPYQLLKCAWDQHKRGWWTEYGLKSVPNRGYTTTGIPVPIPVVLDAVQDAIRVTWTAKAGAA